MAVGRLTRIKHLDVLLKATALLKGKTSAPFVVRLVGEAVTDDDKKYLTELESITHQNQLETLVDWRGAVSPGQIKTLYCQADLTVNLTPTGGLDKAVLESMAAGVPVLTSNQAFQAYLGPYQSDLLLSRPEATEELVSKLQSILRRPDREAIGLDLQQTVRSRADLSQLIKLIITKL
jgi:glycosyltransferase involved in cell wall biosynthesis